MVRAAKNSLAPINRIPSEVLSLILDHCEADNQLVTLTHVCRRWREIFISYPSLWTCLDCADFDKTRVYLERSKASPLEIRFEETCPPPRHDAFQLTLLHTNRLKALSFSEPLPDINLSEYLTSPTPLLEKLEISVRGGHSDAVVGTLSDGDFRTLRELCLRGVITNLPWKTL